MLKKFPPEFRRDLAALAPGADGTPQGVDGAGSSGSRPQCFYRWQAKPICQRALSDAHLVNAIVSIHRDDPEFDYRLIWDELEREGHEIGGEKCPSYL